MVQNFNPKIMGHHIFGGDTVNFDELSPVSALRLNFDQLTSETTDEDIESKNLFGVSMPQFVPQRVRSWIENRTNSSADSDVDVCSNASGSSVSNNNEQLACVSRKVCPFICIICILEIELWGWLLTKCARNKYERTRLDWNKIIIIIIVLLFSQVDNVRMIDLKNQIVGTHAHRFGRTTLRFYFNIHCVFFCFCRFCTCTGSIEKLPSTTTGSSLLIRCKIFLFVTFLIPRGKECHDVHTTLQKLYQLAHRIGKGYENEAFYENIKFQFLWIVCAGVCRKLWKVSGFGLWTK